MRRELAWVVLKGNNTMGLLSGREKGPKEKVSMARPHGLREELEASSCERGGMLHKESWEQPAKAPARERGCKGACGTPTGASVGPGLCLPLRTALSAVPSQGLSLGGVEGKGKRSGYEKEDTTTNPSRIPSSQQLCLEKFPFN